MKKTGKDEVCLIHAIIRAAEDFKAFRPKTTERASAEGNLVINRIHGWTQFVRMERAHEYTHAGFPHGRGRSGHADEMRGQGNRAYICGVTDAARPPVLHEQNLLIGKNLRKGGAISFDYLVVKEAVWASRRDVGQRHLIETI